MPLPIKTRYTIAEARRFIADATGKTVTLSEVLDWGSQGLYRLYAPLEWAAVRQVGQIDIARIRDSIVEIRLSSGQAATLGKGERAGLATCWRDGIECNFVRQKGEYSPGWRTDTVYFGAAGLVLLGAELDAFTASIAAPQQTAPATDTDTAPEPQTAPVAGKTRTPEELAEMQAYREVHTMPETAGKFGISEQRIRQLLPSGKPKAKPFAGLIHRIT